MKLIKEFYDFVYERESIRVRRLAGLPREQWTQDPILQTYKFTNVKREHDRTTCDLMKHFYPTDVGGSAVLLLNCAMARFIGLSDTVLEIGWRPDWSEETRAQTFAVIEARMARRDKIFTSAYIVPNCGDSDPKHVVVMGILDQVWEFAQEYFCRISSPCWQNLIESMCSAVRGMGSFMAKEVVLDFILASGWIPDDWSTWSPVGPGARRGAARVYYGGAIEKLPSERQALEWTIQLYEARAEHWAQPSVVVADQYATSGIELELSDIQFQLCEFDKYMRAKLGEGRPKAKFTPTYDES